MSTPVSSLPDAWVERIWSAMRATYGAAFDRQWQCPADVKPEEHVGQLMAHWARELRGFQQSPQSIGYALENLPPHPPNLVEFKALCIRRPEYVQRQLPAPKADPARVAQALSGISRAQQSDPKGWARRLQAREEAGERMTPAQRSMWREALRVATAENQTEEAFDAAA